MVEERPPVSMTALLVLLAFAAWSLLGCQCSDKAGASGSAATSGSASTSGSAATSVDGVSAPVPNPPRAPKCVRTPGAAALAVGRLAGGEPAGTAAGTGGDADEDSTGALAGAAVEFEDAAEDGSTFLLGLLQHEQESRAGVAVLEAPGAARLLDLGRVIGAAEPPRVAAQGGHWLALVLDPAPSGGVLRLSGITREDASLRVRLGPEVRKGPRDPGGADVAVLASGAAVVVWDRAGPKGLPEVAGLELDARSLKVRAAPFVLSPPDQPASAPRLFAGSAGYWLLWLSEQAESGATDPDPEPGLLAEPPAVLFARPLDTTGRPRGAPVGLNRRDPTLLVLGARVLPDGRLLVAHRSAPTDRPTDDQPTLLSVVSPDGTLEQQQVPSEQLRGPGAPSVLGRPGSDASWLALEDSSGTTELVRILPALAVSPTPVVGLAGRVALAGDPSRLLTAQPRGIGIELEILSCHVQ